MGIAEIREVLGTLEPQWGFVTLSAVSSHVVPLRRYLDLGGVSEAWVRVWVGCVARSHYYGSLCRPSLE